MSKFKKEMFLSPPGIFIIYTLGAVLLILGFCFVFPPEPVPLKVFSLPWRLGLGVLQCIGLFPALVMSALVIPFGFRASAGESYTGFSPRFFDALKGPIITAISAAVVYGVLVVLVSPLTEELAADMRFRSRLFTEAKARAAEKAAREEWPEAARYIGICEAVWPQNPETESIKRETLIALDELRLGRREPGENSRSESSAGYGPAYVARPDQRKPVDAAEALELADRALREERYYDAHWLATLAGRLGSSGSIETVNAARLASRAWNGIASLEPNRREEQTYRLYHLKQTGYGAMIADDWISAYYIFKELAGLTPQDPDVTNFLALCEQKAGELAFFIDEMDMVFGEVLTGVVFSIPQKTASGIPDGRIVIRIQSLTVFADTSYGLELEGVAFDGQGRLIWRVEAPYVKIIPKTLGSEARLVVMMRALNREDKELYREPQWSGSERSGIGNAQIMLDLSYEEFLLLVRVRRGIDNFYIRDFFSAAENLGAFGYVPQVFQAEILRRIAEPFLFLSMTILVIVIGWRFRAKKRSRYMRIPMLGLLPLVFNGVTLIFRSAVSSLSIWLLLSLSFNSAMIVVLAGGAVFFFLSLIFLAAQHG